MVTQKKNKRMDVAAVSPVIGVILMVAITVVLAGVVFYMVNQLGSHKTDTPVNMAIQTNAVHTTDATFNIISAADNLDYQQLIMKVNGVTTSYTHTGTNTISAGDIVTINGLTTKTSYDIVFIYKDTIIASMSIKTL